MRELRQDASGVLRRVEAGERLLVTVSGRPVARLEPLGRPTWVTADELAQLLVGPADEQWQRDVGFVDQRIHLEQE